ncbi:MAG: hypothetical protein MZU95_05390 [Desulfomicrobium escambiense]|nr:hypothetical protein [Desulfomicrobium escambiense]
MTCSSSSPRALRGGSWDDGPEWLRSAARDAGATRGPGRSRAGFRAGQDLKTL